MESLSIVLMEAWLEGTPALISSGSDVLREHVEQFGRWARVRLVRGASATRSTGCRREDGLRDKLGRAGRAYVLDMYGWPFGSTPLPRVRRGAGRMKPIHQLIPAAVPGDAVTGQALAWQALLAEWGRAGEIVAEHVHPESRGPRTPARRRR